MNALSRGVITSTVRRRNSRRAASHPQFLRRCVESSSASSCTFSLSLSVAPSSSRKRHNAVPNDGLTLSDFVNPKSASSNNESDVPGVPLAESSGNKNNKSFYIQTYGCQMNVNDTDIVKSILTSHGYVETTSREDADCVLTNTCAIREKAEQRVWHRLREWRALNSNSNRAGRSKHHSEPQRQVIGVLGCMAERLQSQLLQEGVADVAVGPDHYRDLPRLLNNLLGRPETEDEDNQITTTTSNAVIPSSTAARRRFETYDDIVPAHEPSRISSFVSIQRGCSNHCTFCIVPHVRGPERSRPMSSVVDEVQSLIDRGVKEITLLGQNVNSYHDFSTISTTTSGTKSQELLSPTSSSPYILSNAGFRSRLNRPDGGYWFADLLDAVSHLDEEVRIRFTSPHPKDYPVSLLQLMHERHNICNQLHMPAQSGSTAMLERMRRGYTREAYLELIDTVRSTIPDVALSTDMIAGFCDETTEDHQDSVSLMEYVQYEQAFLFAYSRREQTQAARRLSDTVPPEVKQSRLQQLIDTFQHHVQLRNEQQELGRYRLVLVEGPAKKGDGLWTGRTDQNKRILFPNASCWDHTYMKPLLKIAENTSPQQPYDPRLVDDQVMSLTGHETIALQPGDYAVVYVTEVKGVGLRGQLGWRSSMKGFHESGLWDHPTAIERAALLQSWLTMSASQQHNDVQDCASI